MQIGFALRLRADEQDRFNRTIREQGAQRKRQVGAVDHLNPGGRDEFRQALSAELGGEMQTLPAAFAELFERFLE